MDLLAAIKREERKLEKQLGKLQHDLNRVRAAAKAFSNSAVREATRAEKRVLSLPLRLESAEPLRRDGPSSGHGLRS